MPIFFAEEPKLTRFRRRLGKTAGRAKITLPSGGARFVSPAEALLLLETVRVTGPNDA